MQIVSIKRTKAENRNGLVRHLAFDQVSLRSAVELSLAAWVFRLSLIEMSFFRRWAWLAVLLASVPSAPGQPAASSSASDQGPVVLSRSNPQYPFEERKNGIEGYVFVDFIIAQDGSVPFARPLIASRPPFGLSAAASVRKWRFKPAYKNGVAVNTHIATPIMYHLSGKERSRDLVQRLGNAFLKIATDWTTAHQIVSGNELTKFLVTQPLGSVEVFLADDGSMRCDEAVVAQNPQLLEIARYLNSTLAKSHLPKPMIDLVRPDPSFFVSLPVMGK